nr:COX15/CtaA family protein [Sediminibacterium sp.]
MIVGDRSNKQVATWLLIGVGMTIIQIALGGITRLTGSGLSITQWEVITGTLPPLNEAAWLAEFAKYKQ